MELSSNPIPGPPGGAGATVITVNAARIDASVAIQFKDAMRGLTAGGAGDVILDLSQVSFVDSSGLGAIVGAMKALEADRNMHLAGLTADVDKVFRLTRMDTVFAIHAHASDARAQLAG
ncbi:STAS domain-containing protein [Roseovarius sp. CH_XMU1461]|uniref:STAS domain-containing protein n=1 Tax=Roseovarius sp. CH_XMU1461 TaxID=3107777 RepID=UPI0030098666